MFLDGVQVGDTDVLGGIDEGWSVAMATTGSERGLTLRSPGRFTAVVERLLSLYRSAVRRRRARPTGPRDPGLDGGGGVPAVYLAGRRLDRRRGSRPAPNPVSTRSGGPRWTSACTSRSGPTRRRGAVDDQWMQRLRVLALGADLRGDERDPAQHRGRAGARAAPEVAECCSASTSSNWRYRDTVAALLEKQCPLTLLQQVWRDGGATDLSGLCGGVGRGGRAGTCWSLTPGWFGRSTR